MLHTYVHRLRVARNSVGISSWKLFTKNSLHSMRCENVFVYICVYGTRMCVTATATELSSSWTLTSRTDGVDLGGYRYVFLTI